MALSWYNGHSPDKREQVQKWLNGQWDSGQLPRPCECIVCAQTAGAIHGHLEDYDQPLTYVELCITCHLTLHMRFRLRAVWSTYRDRVSNGWQAPPLSQREGFGALSRTVFRDRWPEGLWRPVKPRRTYLDHLPMTRVAAGQLPGLEDAGG
jgi:hypothetical protein